MDPVWLMHIFQEISAQLTTNGMGKCVLYLAQEVQGVEPYIVHVCLAAIVCACMH